jgi:arylsulfatase A-like enzyme
VSFLTGNFAHTTGVYHNTTQGRGGWPTFNASGYESKTLATALSAAGYRTGMVGKYLNEWNQAPVGFVPPGWDVFRALYTAGGQGSGAYYDYELRGTRPPEVFAGTPDDYSTDVLVDRAVRFVSNTPVDQPLFLMFTPYAPHWPSNPAPRDIGSWTPRHLYRNAAVNEQDMSDKPLFMRSLPELDLSQIDRLRDRTGESLRAVDEAVGRIIKVLGPRMDNTLFIYMSDNGLMWGEHRMKLKNKPHRWSTEVPLIVRWDGHIAPGSVPALATNVDMTDTILDAAGIPNALKTEGISLLKGTRKALVLEANASNERPAYCGVRLKNWMYVEYSDNAGSELYNYRHDPLELSNITDDPAVAAKKAKLRSLAVTLCSPTPPGFNW